MAEHRTGTRCRWNCLRATKELGYTGASVSLTSFASSRWCASRDGWRTQSHRECTEIQQNKTHQRGTSNRSICTRTDVSISKTCTLYHHDVRFLNSILLCVHFVWCLTLSLQLCERASLMWRLGCHTFAHLFTISTCGMGFLGWLPYEGPGRRPGEEIMIHTNCMKNFLVLKWMINPINGFSSQF